MQAAELYIQVPSTTMTLNFPCNIVGIYHKLYYIILMLLLYGSDFNSFASESSKLRKFTKILGKMLAATVILTYYKLWTIKVLEKSIGFNLSY